MDKAEKAREVRLRAKADRMGFQLRRSRRRSPDAWDYGKYFIDNLTGIPTPAGGPWQLGMTLDEVEQYLTKTAALSPRPRRSTFPTHPYAGSNTDRQSVGDPGHCELCAEIGHVRAHPDQGCGDVGCHKDHPEGLACDQAQENTPTDSDGRASDVN